MLVLAWVLGHPFPPATVCAALDLPLDLVKKVIQAQRSGICTCSDLKTTMREKLSEIHERLDELKVLETEIKTMLKSWEPCGGA